MDDLTKKEQSTDEGKVQRRIARLERNCLIMCVAALLLAIFGIALALTTGRLIETFEFLTERLALISEQVDAVRQGIQGA